ncbi:MAG: 50S ribosomal protein L4 [Gammaproteobacteria bacterium]|nr:MAG: 50S ribosomal protein L4 [Gammaproteobacteria bacterium]
MKLKVMNEKGASSKQLDVSDRIFGVKFSESLVHQLVVAYQAGGRQGTRAQKNRAAVRGGGAKPFRQKGTGRARAGTIRSPIWRGGGQIFPARTANFAQKINKKMRQAGLRSILAELVRQDRFVAIDDFKMDAPKTKGLLEKLNKLKASDDVLIVTENEERDLVLSARNLAKVDVRHVGIMDPVSLIGHEKVIMTTAALKRCEEMLA